MVYRSKAFTQLIFPTYIIIITIIVIVFSEFSSKFAKIISKSNPVAVLATMILLSYTKFINSTLGLIFLVYLGPAYGSHNGDLAFINKGVEPVKQSSNLF